jgi:hypothetical protein
MKTAILSLLTFLFLNAANAESMEARIDRAVKTVGSSCFYVGSVVGAIDGQLEVYRKLPASDYVKEEIKKLEATRNGEGLQSSIRECNRQ